MDAKQWTFPRESVEDTRLVLETKPSVPVLYLVDVANLFEVAHGVVRNWLATRGLRGHRIPGFIVTPLPDAKSWADTHKRAPRSDVDLVGGWPPAAALKARGPMRLQ